LPGTEITTTGGPRSYFAKDSAILDDAKKNWKKAVSAEEKQRHREREDLRFQVPDEQWDPLARQARQGGLVNGVPQMARPMISINKLDQPIQLVLNAERSAQLGINIHPISPDANEETAEVFQGLYRAIERNSQARIARSWAFDRAVKAGRGAYRINTRFDEEGGHPFDQVITIERILHQDCVHFDPSATKPDFSDGEFAFVTSWVTAETFKRLYPDAKATYGADDFVGGTFPDPEWVRGDGEDRAYLVAEYFYKDHQEVEIYLLADGSVARKDELNGADVIRDERGDPVTRTLDEVTVKWCKLSGAEVLEKQNWNGRYIPLVPVIGKELQPFESERRWVGVIGPAKDAQRMYNYAASSAIEMAALEPKAPFVGAEGQFEGHEAEWGQANNRSFPYLEYKPTTVDGNLSPPPQRMQVDVSRLGPSMQLLQSADQFIQSATAVFDPGLGRQNSKERSGRAILANREQSEAANSHFVQNLADISMPYEARIILDLIPKIYDREGRICQMLDMEDKSEQVMVNAPFYNEPETGRPMPAPEGMAPPLPDGSAPEVKRFDLTRGIYTVDVNVGASYETRMQAGASEMGEILSADPALMQLIGDLFFHYRDFPGAKQIADRMKANIQHQMPWLFEEENQKGSPEQLQMENQQLKQQMEQMQQALQGMQKELETEGAKQQASLQKAGMEQETQLAKAQMEQHTKLMLAELQARMDAIEAAQKNRGAQAVADTKVAGDVVKESVKADATVTAADLNYRGSLERPIGGELDQI
jgi:hypothetical protein